MIIHNILLPLYSSSLLTFVTLGAVVYSLSSKNFIFPLLILPIICHFLFEIFKIKIGSRLIHYYSFAIITMIVVSGFVTASTIPQAISAILFSPLIYYFSACIVSKTSTRQLKVNEAHTTTAQKDTTSADEDSSNVDKNFDQNRRTFVKLIGTAGLGALALTLFSRKNLPPVFDSMISPEINSDSAIKQSFDNYKIAEVDDSSPSYFGFVEKTGKWFIMQIDDAGAVRYSGGNNNFPANWENRSSLKYDYYHESF